MGISMPRHVAAQAQAQAQAQAAILNLRVQLAAAIHRDALSSTYRAAISGDVVLEAVNEYLCHPDWLAADAVRHTDALLGALGVVVALPGAAAAGSPPINGNAVAGSSPQADGDSEGA